ncbi:MAG: RDD family protein [Spirosomataceae bacterium]
MENLRLAGFGNRLVAQIIDHFIIGAIFSIIILILVFTGVFGSIGAVNSDEEAIQAMMIGLFSVGLIFVILLYMLIPFVYEVIMISSPRRATIGKLVMKIEVVNQHGQTLTTGEAFLRTLIKFLTGNFCLLLWLWPLFNDKEQALHDLTVQGYVVNKV